jgi:hypothetical protein
MDSNMEGDQYKTQIYGSKLFLKICPEFKFERGAVHRIDLTVVVPIVDSVILSTRLLRFLHMSTYEREKRGGVTKDRSAKAYLEYLLGFQRSI